MSEPPKEQAVAGKDYYLILGVARSETPAGIRARYRDLARTLHPDVAGAQSAGAFREVTEAYTVLADPAARQRHNIDLDARERRPPVEPLSTPGALWRPVSLRAEPQAVRPSLEALLERLARNFIGLDVPKAERPEGLTVEVILTPEEARRGVTVPVRLPGVRRCPDCEGSGRVWLFPCVSCGARGVVATEQVVQIPVPPHVRAGTVVEVPLDGVGVHNLYLRLHVWIA